MNNRYGDSLRPRVDHTALRLSLVMPVYNEVAVVEASIARVRAVPLNIELVCVDE
jgi:hypothetical protein